MGIKKNNIGVWALAFLLGSAFSAGAVEIERNTAQMQAMDKITGRVSIIEVPVGGEVKFGTFSIVVRKCKTRSAEETPENFAFVDVADSSFGEEPFNIFKGWMLSSNPAINPVEHPIYDVWLLKCINAKVDADALLSPIAMEERDKLPSVQKISEESKALKENTLTEKAPEEQAQEQPQAEVQTDAQTEQQEPIVAPEAESDDDFLQAINQELENLE